MTELTLPMGVKVFFDETSTIQLEDENNYIQLDPEELTAIYGAYRQMKKEEKEDAS